MTQPRAHYINPGAPPAGPRPPYLCRGLGPQEISLAPYVLLTCECSSSSSANSFFNLLVCENYSVYCLIKSIKLRQTDFIFHQQQHNRLLLQLFQVLVAVVPDMTVVLVALKPRFFKDQRKSNKALIIYTPAFPGFSYCACGKIQISCFLPIFVHFQSFLFITQFF